MLEPVLISEEILTQATLWRTECLSRWNEDGMRPKIGEASLSSPVDGTERKVVLHVASGFAVKGKTFVGLRSEEGEIIGKGYTIVLNRDRIANPEPELMHVLLHEITHSIDPCFDEDVERQDREGQLTDPIDLYNLPSEQRAFSAMWTENLRVDIEQSRYRNPAVSMIFFRQQSVEFDGFYAHCQMTRHDLMDQSKDHIRKIVEHLKAG